MDEITVPESEPSTVDVDDSNKEREIRKSQRRSKEEKLNRKKDEKSIDQVLKALNSLSTPEEKLAAMCKKYTELFDESKRHQLAAKVAEKKLVSLTREKEQLQGEQSKAVLTRSRLESLCRELQRQNKAMKEESLLRIREEEEKRKEVSAKFHATLADITSLMQQNTESNSKLRDENLDMQSKFKSVCEQYELREQQVEKISKQMKLESQLAEAKLRKAKLEMVAEKEILERDKQAVMAENAMYKSKLIDHEKTEEALRAQINVYFEKYDEFQNVLTKSNQVYSGFKGEMEKMSKKITRLEKETSSWKQKWENSHKALLQLAAEKQQKDSEVNLQCRQLTQLQKLCRSLQTERTALLQQLKGLGIAPKIDDASPEKDSAYQETKTEPDSAQPPQESKPVAASSDKTTEAMPKEDSATEGSNKAASPASTTGAGPNPSDEASTAPLSSVVAEPDKEADATVAAKVAEEKPEEKVPVSAVEPVKAEKTPVIEETKISTETVVAKETAPEAPPVLLEESCKTSSESTKPNDTPSAIEDLETNSESHGNKSPTVTTVEGSPKKSPQVTKPADTSPVPNGSTDALEQGVTSSRETPASVSKASPASSAKGSSTPLTGEHKKNKEGGRRRKK